MDVDRFLSESLAPRQESVEVPGLAAFFEKGEAPVWVVRGLTAHELGRAKKASDRGTEDLKAFLQALAGDGDKVQAFRKQLGVDDEDTPEDITYRIECLTIGSVDPPIGRDKRDVAVKLAEAFPAEFYLLTNRIQSLTGQGAEVGKPKPSGKTPKSAK